MNTPWDLEATRRTAEALHGRDQLELLRGPLRSVVDRQVYARIHFQDARAILDKYVVEKLADSSLIEVTFAAKPEVYAEYTTVLRQVSAHLVACVQSMHALPDILAHVLYYALGLNLKSPLQARSVSAKSVVKELRKAQESIGLAELLDNVWNQGQFRQLDALANHSKHRSIIFPALNEDWTGERPERYVVVFAAFEYEGALFPQVIAREFLEAEYNRISPATIAVGNELNRLLHASAA